MTDAEEIEKRVRILLRFVEVRVLLRQYAAKDTCQCPDLPGITIVCKRCAALAILDAEIEV